MARDFDFVITIAPNIVTDKSWYEQQETMGYKPITTFWTDFSIADKFGDPAIKDTYDRAFNEWKSEYKYLTELVLVLNHKCWQHYEKENHKTSQLYSALYYKSRAYALNNLKDEELTYFVRTLD